MNTKDILYFKLKKLISDNILCNIYNLIVCLEVYDYNIASHFYTKVDNLNNSWWNKTHYYIYYSYELRKIIEEVLNETDSLVFNFDKTKVCVFIPIN